MFKALLLTAEAIWAVNVIKEHGGKFYQHCKEEYKAKKNNGKERTVRKHPR